MRSVIACVLALGCGSGDKEVQEFEKARVQMAKVAVGKLAMEYFPRWAVAHASKPCPDSLLEIAKYVGGTKGDVDDPWAKPYKMLCGPGAPKGGFGVLSFGPDKIEGTADDIKSWER